MTSKVRGVEDLSIQFYSKVLFYLYINTYFALSNISSVKLLGRMADAQFLDDLFTSSKAVVKEVFNKVCLYRKNLTKEDSVVTLALYTVSEE